jgi:hypothetical protein
MAAGVLREHWNARDMTVLASGRDLVGRPLPAAAWMAARRLGWLAALDGVTVNDRVARMAQELAGPILRSACWRAALITGVLAAWPERPDKRTSQEWEAVRAEIPGGQHIPSSVIKARTEQVVRFLVSEGRLPIDLFELEPPPSARNLLLLSACDRQQATIQRSDTDPRQAMLRVQLPLRPDPRSYLDWTWVTLPLAMPPIVPAGAIVHLPMLRIMGGQVRADLSFSYAVSRARRTGHAVALGVDWGLNTLLSAGAVRREAGGTITALGAGAEYRAAGVLAKAHRLRRQSERLHAKSAHYARLAAEDEQHSLTDRQAVLAEELRRVSQRRSNLNRALAWSAARWATDQAIAAGASVIYLEDLRTLEARGMGRTLNTRLSQTVRGQITDHIRYLAAEAGIAVVTVPARGTSKHCPCCLAPLHHAKAPDRLGQSGWKWATCPNPLCGWQGDRDQGAWQRIAARGLVHQAKTATSRDTGTMTIRGIDDKMEAAAVITRKATGRDRSKTGSTRRRISRSAPRRRGAPSPPRPAGRGGQRPEGHATTARPLPRAASRDQGASTTSQPAHRPHNARGAALGAGFHLHAHATPPRWETVLLGPTADQRRYPAARRRSTSRRGDG